ncbi:putative NAD(P)H azoreductase [Streptomyces afghaniensis 772]|uniref:Putative NAD(P)H azoreductase n=1 Tax=Streptomyces afghaniensis 772 TaxID=1283301 RepID=S4MIA8_9ACTN|nr:NAD(P)H-binding protein [Streptomyces afghaniensis]EPJ35300.1 putative NAD(P)H azoreductase [Streptomyces afghaniensis 772]
MSDEMILVTGATGKTGRRVARLLRERGVPVRAASRSATPSFDWTDRGTWEPALRGVTGMYVVHPDLGGPQAADDVAAFARQAAAAGARHAVLLSTPSDAWGPAQEHVLAAERALEHAGLDWTVLRVRWFFQNFSEDFLYDPVLSGEVRLPAGDGKEAFVDAEDIAEVAALALTEAGHAGWHYELSGPRLMTFGDAVAEIARATGRDLRYVPLTPEAYAQEQRARGVPEEWVRLTVGLYDHVRSGGLASLGDGVHKALGRAPRDFSEYADTTARQGLWNV